VSSLYVKACKDHTSGNLPPICRAFIFPYLVETRKHPPSAATIILAASPRISFKPADGFKGGREKQLRRAGSGANLREDSAAFVFHKSC